MNKFNRSIFLIIAFVLIFSSVVNAVYIPVRGNPDNYTDIKEHWAYDSISYVIKNGYYNGITKTEFNPEDTMTRAMLVTVLWRLTGDDVIRITSSGKRVSRYVNMFWDIDDDEWFTNYVAWANKNDIISGYSKREFKPNDAVTREQLAVILYNYMKNYKLVRSFSTRIINEPVTFNDESLISDWAKEQVSIMQQIGLMEGRENGNFDPQATVTRAEVSVVIQRLVNML